MKNKLLSICIPTYNRAEVLDDTLNKLFSNPDFNGDLIEVLVSDNCSTDNTAEVVAKYPLVQYYRNEENVKDINFTIALGYATGHYIRLFNDTLSFKPKALGKMLGILKKHLEDKKNVFFYANIQFLNINCYKEFNGIESYFKEVSYFSTWIANFGAWREDFKNIENKEKYADLQFTQVDWSYQIVKNKRDTIIYFDDLFDVLFPNKKGGYHLIKTFVNNYLVIVKGEKLSLISYEIEKYFLCRYFIFPWLTEVLIIRKSEYSFETKNVFGIIFRKYWYEPYFYALLCVFIIRKIIFKIEGYSL
ncbi:glycosyltransferase family 2 protein [Flavobacterium sp. LS1R49]|uniref:Glycosyltransferase family 2 protein n=1 Tax=Flavobacterium shii TaxID=2987687 RepID=A0A9X2ZES4_9FLAO|nr:glycosyltransferase family 2 protein [Flavobacterium shii]MCV9927426.1 glycosyltransferase family 2 protein [Flavobacterium shii]